MTSACLDKAKIRVSSVPGNLGSQQTMNFTLTMLEALIAYIFPFLSCSQINDYLGYFRALFSQECAGFLVLPSVLKNMFGSGFPCFSPWGPCQFLFCFFFFSIPVIQFSMMQGVVNTTGICVTGVPLARRCFRCKARK